MIKEVKHIISSLTNMTLKDLNANSFDSRIDTKFLFHQDLLVAFLTNLLDDLMVLEVEKNRFFHYDTLYCDLKDYDFYRNHHSGLGNRSKVRVRKYGELGPFFFEIKNKSNKGIISKLRVPVDKFEEYKTENTIAALRQNMKLDFEVLTQNTMVSYNRITCANKSLTEKLTIDFDMVATSEKDRFEYTNLIVVEVKQLKFSNRSPFITALKELKVYPSSFSKYCTSVAFLNPDIKKNRFLPIINKVNRITIA